MLSGCRQSVRPWFELFLGCGLVSRLSPSLRSRLSPSLLPRLSPSLPSRLSPSLLPRLSPSLLPRLSPSLPSRLSPSLLSRLSPSLLSRLSPSLLSRLSPSLPSRLSPSLPSRLSPSLLSRLSPSLPSRLSPSLLSRLSPSPALRSLRPTRRTASPRPWTAPPWSGRSSRRTRGCVAAGRCWWAPSESAAACPQPPGGAATQKLRIVTLRFGTGRQKTESLDDGQIPHFRVVRVALGTGYNRGEGNRRASRSTTRNPCVNDSTFCIAAYGRILGCVKRVSVGNGKH
jgi:hypothetical protein